MTDNKVLLAKVKLLSEVNVIPNEGLRVSRLRVELSEEEKPGSAWIAELNVLGDLPWRKGEERKVELRIMSNRFRDYIIANSQNLLVKHGSEIIGNLELEAE